MDAFGQLPSFATPKSGPDAKPLVSNIVVWPQNVGKDGICEFKTKMTTLDRRRPSHTESGNTKQARKYL